MTVHDTAVDGTAPFNANLAAKAAHATPFKRPGERAFRPGSHFSEFYFDETGDTNATSPENAERGRLGLDHEADAERPVGASTGRLTMFYKGDQAHAGSTTSRSCRTT